LGLKSNGGSRSQPAVVVITADDHCIVEANEEAAALVGASGPEALIGIDVMGFLGEREQDVAADAMAKLGDPAPLHVHEYVRVDGTVGRVEVSATPFVWQGRPARRWFAWPLDDDAGELVVATATLTITAADDNAAAFYGVSSATELVGRALTDLFAGGDDVSVRAHLGAAWSVALPAPMRVWVVHRLDGSVVRGQFWSAPAEAIDGVPSVRFYSWPAEPAADSTDTPALDTIDYPDSHRMLVNEDGLILDANQPDVEHLGLTTRDELIGRSMFDFVPDEHARDNPLERWRAMFEIEESSPLKLRIAKRVDGEERCVLSATVPGPLVDGRRTLWVSSWTINGAAREPITTKTPVGFLVSEAWRLDQRTDLLLRSQEHLALAQRRAIAEVETELRADLQQAAAGNAAVVALAARVDQLDAQLRAAQDDVERLQVQMKRVLTASSTIGERATELLKTDPELADQVQQLLLAVAAVGRQLGSMVSGASDASEPS